MFPGALILISAMSVLESPDQFRVELFFIGKTDDDLIGVVDHVIVGHDMAFGIDDESGPRASLLEFPALVVFGKEIEKILKGVLAVELIAEAVAEKKCRKTRPPPLMV